MKQIKALFDPKNIMNPQKVFDYEIAITGANENELNCKNIKFNRLYLSCLDSETFGGKPQRLFMKLLFADDGQILGMQMLGKKEEACTAFVNLPKEFPNAPENLKTKASKSAEELACKK